MASFNKVNVFAKNCAEKVHNLASDQIKLALTNTAPTASGTTVVADLTEISYTNCSSRNITTSSSSQSSGTYKLVLTDLTLTASGGTVGPFRYAVVFNDTPTSPADPVIGWYDYGSSITLNDTETFLVDFDGTNGLLTIA